MNPTKGTTTLGGSTPASCLRDHDVAPTGLLAGVVIATLLVATGAPVVASFALVPAAIAAAFDAVSGRLPDGWVAATALTASLAALATCATSGAGVQGAVIVPTTAVAVGTSALHLVSPRTFAWGDVKYATALAFSVAAAWPDDAVLAAIVWLWVASGTALVEAAAIRRGAIAFGPHLLMAASVVIALAGTEGVGP